jgi:hypothetical protein
MAEANQIHTTSAPIVLNYIVALALALAGSFIIAIII